MTHSEKHGWPADQLFDILFNDFELAIRQAEKPDDRTSWRGMAVASAKRGFIKFQPIQAWKGNDDAFMDHLLKDDLSRRTMDDVGEWCQAKRPEAFLVFEAFAYGALHGKFRAKQIGEPEYLFGAVALASYVMAHCKEIYEMYIHVLDKMDEEDYA